MGIFDQGGGKSAKFDQIGDQIVGKVLSVSVVPKTKFGTSDPDYWKSGDPIMQAKVALQTEAREDGDDDGVRNLFATISSTAGGKFRVIQDAIAEAHGKRADLEPGATLGLRFTGFDPDSANPQNPRKLYAAFYQKPDGAFGAPAAAPQQQQAQPAQQQFQPQQQQMTGFGAQTAVGNQQWQQPAAQQQQDPWTGQPAQQQAPQQQQQFNQGGFVGGPPQAAPAAQQPQAVLPAQQWQQPGFNPQTGELGQQGQQQPGFYGNQPQPPAQQPGIDFAAMGQAYAQELQAHQQQAPAQVPAPQPAAQQPPAQTVDQQRVMALIAAQMPDQVIIDATGISQEMLNMARNAAQGGAPAQGGMPV